MAATKQQPGTISEALLQTIADRAAVRASNGNGNGSGKMLLGMQRTTWVKFIVGGLMAVAAFLAAWYGTVNQQLAGKASRDEVSAAIERAEAKQDKRDSAQMVRVRLLEGGYRETREAMIEQRQQIKQNQKLLEEIRRDVRAMRWPRRGRDAD